MNNLESILIKITHELLKLDKNDLSKESLSTFMNSFLSDLSIDYISETIDVADEIIPLNFQNNDYGVFRINSIEQISKDQRKTLADFADLIAAILTIKKGQLSQNWDKLLSISQKAGKFGVWKRDLKDNHNTWSEGIYKLFELKPDSYEDNFQAFLELIHPEDREKVIEVNKINLEKEEDFIYEYRIICKSGKEKWLKDMASFIRDEKGKIVSIIGTVQDITQLKKSELELQYQKSLLESVANNVPKSYITIIDKDYRLIFTSGQEFRNQRIDPKVFLNLSVDEIFGDKAIIIKSFYKKTFAGEEHKFELAMNNQYYLYKTVPLTNQQGDIDRILVIAENQTDLRKTIDTLQSSEILLSTFIEQSKDAILLINGKGKILMWNQAQEDLCGYSFAEIQKDKIWDVQWSLVPERNKKGKDAGYLKSSIEFLIKQKPDQWEDTVRNIEIITKYGVEKIVQQRFFPIVTPSGVLLGSIMRDITEDFNQVKLLKENEERYRLLTENSVDVIWKMDLRLNLTYISPSAYEMFGYTPKELVGTNISNYTTRREYFKMARKALSSIKKFKDFNHTTLEARILKKDGTEFPVEIIGRLIFGNNKLPIALQGTTRDITLRKKAETERLKNEIKFKDLFNNINVGVALHEMVFDKKGNPIDFIILDVNPKYEEITYLKRKDILNKRGKDVIPNLEDKWIKFYGKVVKTGKPLHIIDHSEYLNKYWDLGVYSPEKNKFTVALTDVTDKVLAEKELLKAKNEAEQYLDMAGSMFVSFNAEGEIVLVNQKGLEILGYELTDIIGKNWFDLCVPANISNRVKIDLDQVMAGNLEKAEHYENDIITKGGEIKTISWVNSFIRDDDGKIKFLLSSGVDITERKNILNELEKHKDKLEDLVKERTKELEEKNKRLEDLNKLFVGREFRIKELRDRIKELEQL